MFHNNILRRYNNNNGTNYYSNPILSTPHTQPPSNLHSSLEALNPRSASRAASSRSQRTPRGSFDSPGNQRNGPTFVRSKSCDLIVNGTAIQPTNVMPFAPHLRQKFTTLSALGSKPTTKPLPFSFSVSTVCRDGSCRRFLQKKLRYARCYDESFETVVQQHARIARNLDTLAARVRRIFAPRHRPLRHQFEANSLDWDVGQLVKNAQVLSRNLEKSSQLLKQIAKARDEMEALQSESSLPERSSAVGKAQLQQQKLERELATVTVIGAHLERRQWSLQSEPSGQLYPRKSLHGEFERLETTFAQEDEDRKGDSSCEPDAKGDPEEGLQEEFERLEAMFAHEEETRKDPNCL